MVFHSISCKRFYARMWSFQKNTEATVLWRGVYDYRIAPRIDCFDSLFKINWRRSQAAIAYCSDKFSMRQKNSKGIYTVFVRWREGSLRNRKFEFLNTFNIAIIQ
jgi:hypothetical protein